jgi:hypothetical protein
VEIVLCGDAATRGASAGLPYRALPRLDGDDFAGLLAERPVCVALFPTGRPAWVHDLQAAGCPVIAVAACMEQRDAGPEIDEGLVAASADSGTLARTIDSLLVDRIRMSMLTFRASERVRDMTDAREAARTLLRAFDTAAAPAPGRHPSLEHDGQSRCGPVAQVA